MKLLNGTLLGLALRTDESYGKIEKLEASVGLLEGRNSSTVTDVGSLLNTIEQLKFDLNEPDQELLCNDIEITSIFEEKGEHLIHIVITLAMKLGVKLSENDLVSATWVGRVNVSPQTVPESRPRPIVVRFGRRTLKDQVLMATRDRRGINTEGTGLPAPHCRFYVNE
ncbi:unnamed protein product [Parnassius apollo]|uniref:(apollo) hypothetical protein n=1 Tax=Parnassius apollo TaxID=110799 RepID=A0A8S3WIT2_PARAO|nr:unnamed protein product [Parnassius apollo]